MKTKDINIWKGISEKVSLEEIINSYKNPGGFQSELVNFIEQLFADCYEPSSIEVGATFGVTSALLPCKFSKTVLDIDAEAVHKAKEFFEKIGQKATFLNMDMFKLDRIDVKYDLVFNSGVIEHFNSIERKKIITNMIHITKKGGFIVIAVPNHESLPYRIGYIYSKLVHKWIYPPEFKVDFKEDLGHISGEVKLIEDLALDKENIYNYLPKCLKKLFRFFDRHFEYEGYLKVVVLRKI